jgi:cytolysin (calcineurin-like family phosphatase)
VRDDTNFMLSLWRTFRSCRWVTAVPNTDGKGTMRVWTQKRSESVVMQVQPTEVVSAVGGTKGAKVLAKRRESMSKASLVRPVVVKS